MKKHFRILFIFIFISGSNLLSQDIDSLVTKSKWEGSGDLNFYFMEDDFFVIPVIRADRGWLHLEARYNYESEDAFSIWGGYNIEGGNQLEYRFTPMVGFVAGDIVGVAPGLEMTFGYRGFEFYSESEYFIAPDNYDENFFYTWTDLTWSPWDWLWVGISGQRTRLYDTDVDIQHGVILGGGFRNWEFTGYLYNPGSEDLFFVAAVSWGF